MCHALLYASRASATVPTADRWAGCCVRRSTTACAGRRRAALRLRRDAARTERRWPRRRSRRCVCRAASRDCRWGSAAGVVVVPATGVERVAFEVLDPWYRWQLRPVERPVRHRDRARAHLVVAVGRNDPARCGVVPTHLGHFGLKAGVLVEIVVLPMRAAVPRISGAGGVFFLRDVAVLRAGADRCTLRCRTARPDSDSSTRCRRNRRLLDDADV